MKNKILLIVFSLLLFSQASAQLAPQNKNWIFGSNAQIEFNSSGITSKLTPFFCLEACAVVSSPITGDLLFYTNGEKIMDKSGNMMLNGDNLKGSETSTQGALILPHPKFENQFLLFTTPSYYAADAGLYYNVIDMNLNNGLGAIVSGQKNILLYDNITEGLTYTYNADSSGYWLLAHERLSNTFLSFEITNKDIGLNVIKSKIGRNWGRNQNDKANFMSYIKISPNGKRIAVSHSYNSQPTGLVEVYGFNNCSGIVEQEIIISNLPYICYGTAFSSNSNVLYITSLEFPSKLFQVNLLAGSEVDINASLSIIYTAPKAPANQYRTYYLAGLQLYDDGKIYITESAQKFLHCINNPNELGSNCNFEPEKVKLTNGSFSRYTLPQLVPVEPKEPKTILDLVSVSINDTCIKKIKKATLIGIINPTDIEWKLINTAKSDTILLTDSIDFTFSNLKKGKYILEVFVKQNCKNYIASKQFNIIDCDCNGKIEIDDTCINNAFELFVNSNDAFNNIEWLVEDNNGKIIINQISLRANFSIDTIQKIKVRAIVNFSCKPDTLNAVFNLSKCYACTIYIPNAFSPNNDGVNDSFNISSECEIVLFNLNIFNRWGEKIYQSNRDTDFWDGTYRNSICPDGVYLYYFEYKFKGLTTIYESGAITLIR